MFLAGCICGDGEGSGGLAQVVGVLGRESAQGVLDAVAKLTKDYLAQRKEGLVPHFKAEEYPELKHKIDHDIWS